MALAKSFRDIEAGLANAGFWELDQVTNTVFGLSVLATFRFQAPSHLSVTLSPLHPSSSSDTTEQNLDPRLAPAPPKNDETQKIGGVAEKRPPRFNLIHEKIQLDL